MRFQGYYRSVVCFALGFLFSAGYAQTIATPIPRQGEPQTEGHILLLGGDEDWHSFCNRSKHPGRIDRVKCLPLNSEQSAYASIGGQSRTFFENYWDENFGATNPGHDGDLIQRFLVHTNVVFNPRLRVFFEFQSGLETGRRGGPRPVIDRDAFDAHQGFLEFGLGGDGKPEHAPPARVRIGRQELVLGQGREVDLRELPNLRNSFDGVRIGADLHGDWQIDAFALRPVLTNPGVFNDAPDHAETFWGVYSSGPLSTANKLHVDGYYLGDRLKKNSYLQGAHSEMRHTLGGRLWRPAERWDGDFEAAYQFGSFGPDRIRAYTLASRAGYTLQDRFKSRIGVEFGLGSGDRNPKDDSLNTFRPPFPRGSYFGVIGATGPENALGFAPVLTFHPTHALAITPYAYFFWRASLADGLYGVPGRLLRAGKPGQPRYVGTQPEVDISYTFDPRNSLVLSWAELLSGGFIQQNPPALNTNYLAVWYTFRF